jgi:hypothetical protein
MKASIITTTLVLASALSSFAGTTGPAAPITHSTTYESQDEWTFMLAPYIWAASVDAESNLPWNGPSGSDSVQRFDTKITGAFMLEAMAKYRSVGLLVDFNWLQLDTETLHQGTLYSGADLQTDYIYTTAALTYTLPLEGAFHMDLMAGARLWNISADFDLQAGTLPSVQSSNSETWVSPLAGARMRYDLTCQWFLFAEGTAGGFSGSNSQWDAVGGAGYQFSDWCAGTIGYRYLSEDYDNDDFVYNASIQGAQVGLVFKF